MLDHYAYRYMHAFKASENVNIFNCHFISHKKDVYSRSNEHAKKNAQKVWSEDLVLEEPFGYRVAHHGYLKRSGHFYKKRLQS